MNSGEYQDHEDHDAEREQGPAPSEEGDTEQSRPDLTAFLAPKVNLPDLSGFLPKVNMPDFSGVFPKVDLPNLAGIAFPKIDVTNLGVFPRMDLPSLIGQLPNQALITGLVGLIDMPKVDFSGLLSGLRETLEKISEAQPPNWPEGMDLDHAESILNNEGIPLVWVPRAEIISLLLQAADRTARLQALVDNRNDVLIDCRKALDRITHASFKDQLPLAKKAVAALEAGFDEPAQALAVTVTETAVAATISGNYGEVKRQVHLNFDEIPYTLLRIRAALAPIGVFYTSWYAHSNTPKPAELSRHVTVHAASIDHYTPGNALVAVMLMASVLCALQELEEQADQQGTGT